MTEPLPPADALRRPPPRRPAPIFRPGLLVVVLVALLACAAAWLSLPVPTPLRAQLPAVAWIGGVGLGVFLAAFALGALAWSIGGRRQAAGITMMFVIAAGAAYGLAARTMTLKQAAEREAGVWAGVREATGRVERLAGIPTVNRADPEAEVRQALRPIDDLIADEDLRGHGFDELLTGSRTLLAQRLDCYLRAGEATQAVQLQVRLGPQVFATEESAAELRGEIDALVALAHRCHEFLVAEPDALRKLAALPDLDAHETIELEHAADVIEYTLLPANENSIAAIDAFAAKFAALSDLLGERRRDWRQVGMSFEFSRQSSLDEFNRRRDDLVAAENELTMRNFELQRLVRQSARY